MFVVLWLEVSTVWIFTTRLPWTVVGFVTRCQRFVNGLEINEKTNTIFLNLMKLVDIVVAEYLLFDRFRSIFQGDSAVRRYLLTHILRTRARLEWKLPELPTTFAQL